MKKKKTKKALETEEYKRKYIIKDSVFVFEKGSKPKFLVGKPENPPHPPNG